MGRLGTLTAVFLATVGLLVAAVAAFAQQGQGGTLNLDAGYGDGVISMNGFSFGHTGAARVAVGTTVIWTLGSDEGHTVTFLAGQPRPELIIPQPEDPAGRPPMLNPAAFFPSPAIGPWDGTTYVNSSPLGRGQQFPVTFGKAGRYEYVCLFHPPMTGVIEVVEAGSAGIMTQTDVRSIAAHMAAVHDAEIAKIYAERNAAGWAAGPNGNSIWFVRAGTDWKYGHLDILGFLPDNLEVWQGDTVVWTVDHGAPHTVTFPVEGAAPPDTILIQLPDGTTLSPSEAGPPPGPGGPPPDPSLPPRLVLGPGFVPAGAPVYDGVSFANSGIFGYDGNTPLGSQSWALTFGAPGTYQYICLLHDLLGMTGTITVLPR